MLQNNSQHIQQKQSIVIWSLVSRNLIHIRCFCLHQLPTVKHGGKHSTMLISLLLNVYVSKKRCLKDTIKSIDHCYLKTFLAFPTVREKLYRAFHQIYKDSENITLLKRPTSQIPIKFVEQHHKTHYYSQRSLGGCSRRKMDWAHSLSPKSCPLIPLTSLAQRLLKYTLSESRDRNDFPKTDFLHQSEPCDASNWWVAISATVRVYFYLC